MADIDKTAKLREVDEVNGARNKGCITITIRAETSSVLSLLFGKSFGAFKAVRLVSLYSILRHPYIII